MARAEFISTNWDGIVYGILIPKTDFALGESIPVILMVSNTSAVDRRLFVRTGDRCGAGFGDLIVSDERTGKQVGCAIPVEEWDKSISHRMDLLLPHDSEAIDGELRRAFALNQTNVYRIQAFGRFPSTRPSSEGFTLAIPPILISITAEGEPAKTTPPPATVSLPKFYPVESQSKTQALSLSISIPSQPNGEHILENWRTPSFHVVLSNISDKRQRVWAPWSDGSEFCLSFETIDTYGVKRKISRRYVTRVSRKLPEPCVLEPGESLVLEVDYTNTIAWDYFPKAESGYPPILLRAVYENLYSSSTDSDPVWTGRIVSPPLQVKVYPKF